MMASSESPLVRMVSSSSCCSSLRPGRFEQVRRAQDAVHRGAEFVADVGNEFAPAAHRVEGSIPRRRDPALPFHPVADVTRGKGVKFRFRLRPFRQSQFQWERPIPGAEAGRFHPTVCGEGGTPLCRGAVATSVHEGLDRTSDQGVGRAGPEPFRFGVGAEDRVVRVQCDNRFADRIEHGVGASEPRDLHAVLMQESADRRAENGSQFHR